jgi:hypothetical protein
MTAIWRPGTSASFITFGKSRGGIAIRFQSGVGAATQAAARTAMMPGNIHFAIAMAALSGPRSACL